MSPERRYWRAVERLREAEALASIAGKVSGPADTPPTPGNETAWYHDWIARAQRALAKGRQLMNSHVEAQKARGRAIAERVKKGVEAIEHLPEAAARGIHDGLQKVKKDTFDMMLVTALLLLAAVILLPKLAGAIHL